MDNKLKSNILITIFCLLFAIYAIYSYAFLDIGLTLTSFDPYLNLQKKMRWFGYFNRPQSTIIFILLSCLLFIVYYLLFKSVKQGFFKLKSVIILSIVCAGFLIFSYPAFSHDIFNYIFNAKMVLVYHADPHKQVAMNFPDPMLGFMRNIHTPAPYYYGWTLISLLPFVLGFNRIFPELISFKIFAFLLFWVAFIILKKIYSLLNINNDKLRLTFLLLNPLILIEAIGIGHNDFGMMLPALLSYFFLIKYKKNKHIKLLLTAFLCFLFSVSTKYATIVLLPLFIIWYFNDNFDLGLWGAILLFLLPFLRPLDQLHSWYLIWPLIWILLSKRIRTINFFYFLSFFALFRYLPYIWYGDWDPPVVILRLLIYLLIPLLFLPIFFQKKLKSFSKKFSLKIFG